MDTDGVEIEVLYPTVSFGLWKAPDIDYQYACMRAYNRWIVDYIGEAPDRLVGLGLASLSDIEAAVTEVQNFRAMGLRGVCIAAILASVSTTDSRSSIPSGRSSKTWASRCTCTS